eukprot:4322855-Prymnesium_polylepis.1
MQAVHIDTVIPTTSGTQRPVKRPVCVLLVNVTKTLHGFGAHGTHGCDSTVVVSVTSLTSQWTRIWSRESALARAVACIDAVTKPNGWKQPAIQTDGGSTSTGLVGADQRSSQFPSGQLS